MLTPKISTYHALVTTLFAQQGLPLPSRFVEADDETVITNLVASGVGASLLREESALELERAGTAKVWGGTRVVSTLWFIALAARRDDPLIKATFDLVRELVAVRAGERPPGHRLKRRNAVAEKIGRHPGRDGGPSNQSEGRRLRSR